jgi:flavin-dependent dehydrogenase
MAHTEEGTTPGHRIAGAGPAGLVAALTLAREGRHVRVYEKSANVGHRFNGDFEGLEAWSSLAPLNERLTALGVKADFAHKAFHDVTFYDEHLRPVEARTTRPLFHLVRRGSEDGSLDRALLDQARAAGAEVLLGKPAEHAYSGDIISIGPRFADGLATGYVFATELPDQAHCIVSDDLAPAGYAYVLIWDGRATLATCLFDRQNDWKLARERTVDAFQRLIPGLRLDNARPFSGYGSVFGSARYTDEAGHLFVGEAAGLQDPEWGFGMWYAMESGHLAARSILEGFDYATAAGAAFDARREAAFFNRLFFERLPRRAVPPLLRRGAQSEDLVKRIHDHWQPNRLKSFLAHRALPRFERKRLHHRDKACHSPTCDCVWCTHGASSATDHGDTSHDHGHG